MSSILLSYVFPDSRWFRLTDLLEVHVDATEENNHNFQTTNEAKKLMHRFSEQQVESTMDEAMKFSG